MLVSHPKRFIFLKTKKTAGTSVEIFLEQFCETGYAGPSHHRPESVTEAGIIGSRGAGHASKTFFNHAPARLVRDAVGPDVWGRYRKITCIRDPFDKTVSAFWMWQPDTMREAPLATVREAFRAYVLGGKPPVDRDVYTIDDAPCCDTYLRFERLVPDLAALSAALELPFEPERLGRYKANFRPRAWRLADYYERDTINRVRSIYGPECAWFGYGDEPSRDAGG